MLSHFRIIRTLLVGCVVTLIASLGTAFPPAPGIVVFGIVKDTHGETVDGENAFIVFKSGDFEIARTRIRDGLSEGENYRALLPADMGSGDDSYRDGILNTAVPFTVEVVIGGRVFEPIESSRGIDSPDEAGSVIRFDFSLGTDSDGDGLPDEWEYGQLRISGLRPGDELYNLDQFTADGDYDEDGLSDRNEYLAGTFAYLGFDTFSFKLVRFTPEEGMMVSFLGVRGRSYSIVGSSDLMNWEAVEFSYLHLLQPESMGEFEADNTAVYEVLIPSEALETFNYFKVRVR